MEELVRAAEQNSGGLCVGRACVDQLLVEHALFMSETEQASSERDTLPTRVGQFEVSVATHDGELVFVVQTVRWLESCIAAGEERADTAEA